MKPIQNTSTDLRFSILTLIALCLTGWSGCDGKESSSGPVSNPVHSNLNAEVCIVHKAPMDRCFICDAGLRDKDRLWCHEHASYEDRCWKCHPELEDKNRLYCREHSLYEDECFLCHPEILDPAQKSDAPDQARVDPPAPSLGEGLMCQEHGVLERECGICHPELLGENPIGKGLKVRLPSERSAERTGLLMGHAETGRLTPEIECLAELTFDLNRLAEITPLTEGIIQSVEVDFGSRVREGDVLARIASVTIGEAQAAFLQAVAEVRLRETILDRQRKLREQLIASENDLLQAEASFASIQATMRQARQRLAVLGFTEDQINSLKDEGNAVGVMEIRAPFDGEIIERNAVRGSMATMEKALFTLADTSKVWAIVRIPESQLPFLHLNQKVTLEIDSMPGLPFPGLLTWVASKVDPHTRMVRARVELKNPEGRLKAGMFARAIISGDMGEQAAIVPLKAVHDLNGVQVVFVQSSADLYEARPVLSGTRQDGRVEILAGLDPGDNIVVDGTFSLKSQFLLSRLGAGCVH